MKFVLFWSMGQARPGLLCDRGVVDLSTVIDPLKRTWERGVYLGADSTNHAVTKAGTKT